MNQDAYPESDLLRSIGEPVEYRLQMQGPDPADGDGTDGNDGDGTDGEDTDETDDDNDGNDGDADGTDS